MTVPDTLHTGLQNRTGTGYFGTRAGTQNKACLSTELHFLSISLSIPHNQPPSCLLPELEQELIVPVMVSGGGIDQR